MPPKLPQKYREIHRKLIALGFELDHTKGSHAVYRHPGSMRRAVVPKHLREIPKGTVKAIIRESGIDIDQFFEA
jgi:predicted RNA binding protein YcfA (HicA-like mRNA interferase family)